MKITIEAKFTAEPDPAAVNLAAQAILKDLSRTFTFGARSLDMVPCWTKLLDENEVQVGEARIKIER